MPLLVQLPSFDLDATTLPESLKRSGVLSRAAAVEDKAYDAARGHGHSQAGSARLATEVLECFHARTDGGDTKENSNGRDGRDSKDDVVYLHLSSAVEPSLFAQSVSRMQELHELGPSVRPHSAMRSLVVLPRLCVGLSCVAGEPGVQPPQGPPFHVPRVPPHHCEPLLRLLHPSVRLVTVAMLFCSWCTGDRDSTPTICACSAFCN